MPEKVLYGAVLSDQFVARMERSDLRGPCSPLRRVAPIVSIGIPVGRYAPTGLRDLCYLLLMVRYRRDLTPGATYFFTVTLRNRSSRLLVDRIDELRAAVRAVRNHHPFNIDAMVVLPDHLHAIWTLPEDDSDYSLRWKPIKRQFTNTIKQSSWQSRFWEHRIRDNGDYERHVDYIHWNPVKHGHVTLVRDWPHSSFHLFVRNGMLPIDWGGATSTSSYDFGEPK